MDKRFKNIKIEFSSTEQYFSYCFLDGYKVMRNLAGTETRKELKQSHHKLYLGLYFQILGWTIGALSVICFFIKIGLKIGLKIILEMKIVFFWSVFVIAFLCLGMIPILTYKKHLKEIMPKSMSIPSVRLEEIDPPKVMDFMESGLELTTMSKVPMFIAYSAFTKIGVYKHVISFEIENNTSKYYFLLPQEMIKEKKDWKMIRRYLRSLNNSTTRKNI